MIASKPERRLDRTRKRREHSGRDGAKGGAQRDARRTAVKILALQLRSATRNQTIAYANVVLLYVVLEVLA